MADNSIVQTIQDAEIDARSLSEFLTESASFMVTRRLAPSIHSLQYYLDFLNTIPSIVQNAIDNTAIEGGVLADTFLTVAPNNKISTPVNQRMLTAAMIGSTYYASLNGFATGPENAEANSDAWDILKTKLEKGDVVVFSAGEYYFTRPLDIRVIAITLKGSDRQGTHFYFRNGSSGIERYARGGSIEGLFIEGSGSTGVSLDLDAGVFGSVGLRDFYTDEVSSGYSTIRDVHISYFDVGRVCFAEGAAPWSGAYRDIYSTFIQRNRVGCVFYGATDEKFYGGAVSANTDVGIYAVTRDSDSIYNNIKFIGTTIEGNGKRDTSVDGNRTLRKNKCNIYAQGSSSVYLVGAYQEDTQNLVVDNAQLYTVASHIHKNCFDYAFSGGSLHYSANNSGRYTPVPLYKSPATWFSSVNTGATTAITNDGYLQLKGVRNDINSYGASATITLNKDFKAKDNQQITVKLSYKLSSGYTVNPSLFTDVNIYVYGRDGSTTRLLAHPDEFTSKKGELVEMTATMPIKVSNTPINNHLNMGASIYKIMVLLSPKTPSGNPDFTTENLILEIQDLQVALHIKDTVHYAEHKRDAGTTLARPLLTTDDAGYRYYNESNKYTEVWNGASWWPEQDHTVRNISSSGIGSVANDVNINGKFAGRMVVSTTDNKLYIATGATPTSNWVASDSSNTITPV